MQLAQVPTAAHDLPTWPPLLATRGVGGKSSGHAHHAMHLVLARAGELRVRAGRTTASAPGVLTAPDIAHALDATGLDVLLVFIDPESDVGAALRATLTGPVRLVDAAARDALAGTDPIALMRDGGEAWTREVVARLGAPAPAPRPPLHPRVRKLLRLLRAAPAGADVSLDALAASVGLSPGRLMHAFTESIGIPLRPYLAWLRLQRAAGAIVAGEALSAAAAAAGFSDAAHMSRTFRRMLGMAPSVLRPQPVRS